MYGVSPPQDPQAAGVSREPSLSERHYTPEMRSVLPAMHLSSHDPLMQAATDAGFEPVSPRAMDDLRGWETSAAQTFLPALVAHRPAEP